MHLLAAAVAAAVAGDEVVVLDVTGGESVTGSLLIWNMEKACNEVELCRVTEWVVQLDLTPGIEVFWSKSDYFYYDIWIIAYTVETGYKNAGHKNNPATV